jgi:alpha-tubulin suppressor-like RCC1 family protein
VATSSISTFLVSEDGKLWSFGSSYGGQLGLEDNVKRNVPTNIQREDIGFPEDVKIIGVSCGYMHTVLLSEDGNIWTFGYNIYGQLGHGECEEHILLPTEIRRQGQGGQRQGQGGQRQGQGGQRQGQGGQRQGQGQRQIIGLPKDVKIIGVSCGSRHTVLLSEDGKHIWTFGNNDDGQLGHGDNGRCTHRKIPTEIPREEYGLPEYVRIVGASCGEYHTVLLSDDGCVWTFGNNNYGQLGLGMGDTLDRNVPTEIQGGENEFPEDVRIVRAYCGSDHTVLLSDDGRIWTFGFNEYGQLGHGDKENRNVPTEIQRNKNELPEDVRIVDVSCGENYTVLISDDGRIWTFGDNGYGQLGHGDKKKRKIPTEIQRGLNGLHKDVRIIGASCGNDHTVLISDTGDIWTFGNNVDGQLGHEDTKNRNVPSKIKNLSLRQQSLTKSANKT